MATVLETTDHYTIRLATMDDIVDVVRLGREFLLAGPYCEVVKDNEVQAMETATKVINSPDGRVLVAEVNGKIVGLLALYFYNHYFSGLLTASELIWYVEKEHRAVKHWPGGVAYALLTNAERLAAELGAACMQLTAPTQEVGKFYERYGYRIVEVGYQRRLNASN